MSISNPIPYLQEYQSFDTIVYQRTNTRGMAQSFWSVSATYTSSKNQVTQSDTYDIRAVKRMALDDIASVFCTYGKMQGMDVFIGIMIYDRALSNKTSINLVQEDGGVVWNGEKLTNIPLSSATLRLATTTNIGQYLSIYGADADTVDKLSNRWGLVYATGVLNGDNTGAHSSMSINSTPTFDINDADGIIDYIDNGNRAGAVVDNSVNWTVYIDKEEFPNAIKIVWRSPQLEQIFRDGADSADNMYINLYTYNNSDGSGDKLIIQSVKYSQSYIQTSFLQICEFYDRAIYFDLTSNRPQAFFATIIFFLELYTKDGLYSVARVQLNQAGDYFAEPLRISATDSTTIAIVIGTGSGDGGYRPPISDDDVGNETSSTDGYTALNLLSTTYQISLNSLKQLNSVLWAKSFAEAIAQINVAPIENIISCKIVPTAITGTADIIELGNYPTSILGYIVQSNIKITLGKMQVSGYYNSFLDYAPFTKLTIYIPYIGFKELDTSQFMGHMIKVEYIIDVITASCKALLFADDIYVQSFDGQCGIDIPVTASNRAQVEASYISGALGAIGELATGDILGAASGALNTAMTPYHYNTQGAYNPSCGSFETKLCYLIIDRPTADYPNSYAHDVGYPCHLSAQLSTLKGYTKCYDSIDLSGIPCTESEREMIHQYLTSGVYI